MRSWDRRVRECEGRGLAVGHQLVDPVGQTLGVVLTATDIYHPHDPIRGRWNF